MKKILIFPMLVSLILFCSAFIGVGHSDETPGEIHFIGDAGSENDFIFERWQFTEVQIPDQDMEQLIVALEINTSSIRTDWKELEKSIRKKKDYFYVKKFPKATVKIQGAEKIGEGRYQTNAQLTLKGITETVVLTFSVNEEPPYRVQGEGVIQRRNFKFSGDGPKDEVPIRFDVILPD